MTNLAPDVSVLKRNLEALGPRSRSAIEAIISSTSRPDVIVEQTPDSGVSLVIGEGASKRQLSSRRGPREEASRLCDTVDVRSTASVVVSGFGAGSHVVELAKRIRKTGLIVCFEPDVGLLKAILERVDLSESFSMSNVVIITKDSDRGAIAEVLNGFEGALAAGVSMLRHPPSVPVLGERIGAFEKTFTEVMKAVRTAVLTTLVQVDTTVRNLLQNVGPYCTSDGIADLKDCAKGRAAVVVSAGPSLRRNIDLLKIPENRNKVVVIAVQTVLKTLLKEGIRPNFVTALDYHEISKRFYEGLTSRDVEGITLVAEPKANPAIIDAYPGDKRFVGDKVLDEVLGAPLATPKGELKPGATVAHLAYYLARHLGCDPVILIGQDLGFTDNQYYAPGAAIHRVWGGELNEFNTLEMMEWQRIARMRNMLRRVPALGGGEIYSDEQMATYLVQFERDFLDDTARGLTVIDATEGGALKKHTHVTTLKSALDAIHRRDPFIAPRASSNVHAEVLGRVQTRIASVREDTDHVRNLSLQTRDTLERMLDTADVAELNRLIDRARANGEKVAELSTAHRLVQFINQAGQLNRYKADRAITLDDTLTPKERQRRQIERDIKNVTWISDVAHHTANMLRDCENALGGAPKITRDEEVDCGIAKSGAKSRKVIAVIIADTSIGGLGTPRDLEAPIGESRVFATTLDLLSTIPTINEVVVVCRDETLMRSLIGNRSDTTVIAVSEDVWRRRDVRAEGIAAARVRASSCWRGGLANMTCYDEAFFAPMVMAALEHSNADAAAVVGPDWCFLNTQAVRETISRYLESPGRNAFTFSQAPAGKGTCVLVRELVSELAACDGSAATIGALLGYHPIAPQSDPIAKPQCVQIESTLRDTLGRFIADSACRRDGVSKSNPSLWNITPGPNDQGPSLNVWRSLFASVSQSVEDASLRIDARCSDEATVESLVAIARSEGLRHIQLVVDSHSSPRLFITAANIVTIDFGSDCSDATRKEWSERLEALEPFSPKMMPKRWFVPTITRNESTLHELEAWYDFWILQRGAAVIQPDDDPRESRIRALPVPDFVREYADRSTVHIDRAGEVRLRGAVVGRLGDLHPLEILERMEVVSCETALEESAR